MIISKIILNNYRLYQGVNEIEFKAKNGKNRGCNLNCVKACS